MKFVAKSWNLEQKIEKIVLYYYQVIMQIVFLLQFEINKHSG